MSHNKNKILIVFGTRPEVIKMSPLIIAIKQSSKFEVSICSTSQHKDMVNKTLDLFDINTLTHKNTR